MTPKQQTQGDGSGFPLERGMCAGYSVPPPAEPKPEKCSRCNRTVGANGKKLAIHWSMRCGAWMCMTCHFEAAEKMA